MMLAELLTRLVSIGAGLAVSVAVIVFLIRSYAATLED